MTAPLLEACDLEHSYGAYQALAPTDLSLHPGEITALIGSNGAGKTTLLHCLSGLLYPTGGDVFVEGFHLHRQEVEAKQRLAFLPDVPRFYTELTAWEHLRFYALAFGAGAGFEERAEGLLKEFNLWEARDLFPHHYSRGMRLKLGLVMSLIRPFRVLLMDEPTSALDPEGVDLVREKLLGLRREGEAVLLSSHNLDFAGNLADRVWRMHAGEIEIL